jgi:hypothetical protein
MIWLVYEFNFILVPWVPADSIKYKRGLEVWYYAALLVLVGLLKNAKLQLDIMSVW